jgi:hypothetical protein
MVREKAPVLGRTFQLAPAPASADWPAMRLRAHPWPLPVAGLALQLLYLKASESMGNHDSKVVDADSVD